MNKLTKDGLTGNSGFVGCFHLAANYAAGADMIFVSYSSKKDGFWWKRIPKDQPLKKGERIITCFQCENPAISLDHHWPAFEDFNYCEEHRPKREGE